VNDRLASMHRASTLVLSAIMVMIGVALIVVTLLKGGGPFARGVIFGVLFTLAGGGRLYFTARRM
jgi:hypothetical protein